MTDADARAGSPAADRYARQRAIEGFDQARVGALSVAVIGAGAIGNEVVKNLVLLGVGRIAVFDFDTVEVHNLTRSILLRESDIGRPKAHAVVERARAIDPAVRLRAFEGDIADTLTPARLRDCDLLIGAVDNFEARIRANQMCLLLGRPWVNAAIDDRHASVDVFPFDDAAGDCACYECALPESVYNRLAERRSCGGLRRAALRERLVPTTTITASLAGALAVAEGLRLTGCDRRADRAAGPPARAGAGGGSTPAGSGVPAASGAMTDAPDPAAAPGRPSERLFLDASSGRGSRTSLARSPLCPGCGLTPRAVGWLGAVRSAADAARLLAEPDDAPVHLSDALIWRCECRRCGRVPLVTRHEDRRAAAVGDHIAICPQCGANSVDIDIRDTLTLGELRERFAGGAPPVAWLRCGERFVEFLQEDGDE